MVQSLSSTPRSGPLNCTYHLDARCFQEYVGLHELPPSKKLLVFGTLLGLDPDETFLRGILTLVAASCPIEGVIEQVETWLLVASLGARLVAAFATLAWPYFLMLIDAVAKHSLEPPKRPIN